jgi:hypothetical protein
MEGAVFAAVVKAFFFAVEEALVLVCKVFDVVEVELVLFVDTVEEDAGKEEAMLVEDA